MATDDLKARLLHGEGRDWDLPYATRKEAHDYIEALEAQLAARDAALDRIAKAFPGWNSERVKLLRGIAATAIASGDYAKGQTDAQQGDA